MPELPRHGQPLIQPVYSQAQPNDPISLGKEKVEFTLAGKRCRRTAKVMLMFVPKPRLRFRIRKGKMNLVDQMRLFMGKQPFYKVSLPDRNMSLEGFFGGDGKTGLNFSPRYEPVSIRPPAGNIASAIVHLFNFPDFAANEDYVIEESNGSSARCGRVCLRADGWTVTIAAMKNTRELVKALRSQGGNLITHVIQIEHESGSFTSQQLEEVLSCLHYFLSFALGRWSGLALTVGSDTKGDRIFEQWGLRSKTGGAWNGTFSWFSAPKATILAEVFSGFLVLWKDPLWEPTLREVIYWYVNANQHGRTISKDTGIILAQTALESLAWVYCVQFRAISSKRTFKRRTAADNLRHLASALDIPLALPKPLSQLPWKDSMDAITQTRNAIVHPAKKNRKRHDDHFLEVWNLALWYVEMVLLRLCNHRGDYSCRLVPSRHSGKLERVPWAETENKEQNQDGKEAK